MFLNDSAYDRALVDCLKSTAINVEYIVLGSDIWIVYAHGSMSKMQKLNAKSLKALEQFTPSGTAYFALYVIATNDRKEIYHLSVDDLNLNTKSSHRHTNHFVFNSKIEAEYYLNLCKEFNIQAAYDIASSFNEKKITKE